MKARSCPCCKKKISIKAFLHHMFFATTRISFTENSKGFLCPKCQQPILCAERKEKILMPLMGISFIPFALFGIGGDISLSLEYGLNAIAVLSLSVSILVSAVIRKYHKIDFICNDKSSDDYNNHRIQG